MGNHQSTPLEQCLSSICADQNDCVSYPSNPLYGLTWSKPYNLAVSVTPAAVVRPETAADVAKIVRCANEYGYHVQAKSGGHSYANHGLGGEDGGIEIDLVKFRDFSMDDDTWQASVGAGLLLGDLDKHLHENGRRAIAHGSCPGVGIGGHATVGGLGPMSRMWGSTLDHVVGVEVVTANGTIVQASEDENAELFWALRGAGASFGIVTKFLFRTHEEPGDIVQNTYRINFGSASELAALYKDWQALIAEPDLDPRFSTLFIAQPTGAIITGTFYGTEDEFVETGIKNRLQFSDDGSFELSDWLSHLANQWVVDSLWLSNLSTAFYSNSLAFRSTELLPDDGIDSIFDFLKSTGYGLPTWSVIFNSEGGAMADIPINATAYPHRDKIMMYQSYAVGIPVLTDSIRGFLDDLHSLIMTATPNATSTYAGYVNPKYDRETASKMYWEGNLARLQDIKRRWDPDDVFRNPQAVSPAT